MRRFFLLCAAVLAVSVMAFGQRHEMLLTDGWRFYRGDAEGAQNPSFDDAKWQQVVVPHDWAIYGPFGGDNDLQKVAVTQNGEKEASVKTGRTGGLPWTGVGWYRRMVKSDELKVQNSSDRVALQFDGAMSEAHVYVNGKEAIFWPYGYNTFYVDVTDLLNKDGKDNVLAIRLENREQSSRWYPGAGLYRNVHLVTTHEVHIPVWGTYITTPHVEKEYATVCLKGRVAGSAGKKVSVETSIFDDKGKLQGTRVTDLANMTPVPSGQVAGEQQFVQNINIEHPRLWSPEHPILYKAVSKVLVEGKEVDAYETRFGVRTIELVAEKGFFLNGEHTQFKGVCLHHDLGPLGAAINKSAIRHQLEMLKDMGCIAIRTSHNMPTPELVELCDEMGLMVMVEPFDEWDVAKCKNGYHRYWNEWAEKDMVNMLHHYRNNASVVMWSIGNEVPTQGKKDGYKMVEFLQGICHREDPTRPVTCGMDQVWTVLRNGFAATIDVPGFNYRTQYYYEGHEKLPQGYVLGSETASTVSSRGTYHFPVKLAKQVMHPDNQSSGYDVEACSWSNVPDEDFMLAEYNPCWEIGQFVWTGFDYLGEPSPYDTDAWPSHSSVFGIVDLASLPKDRYYLYRSVWNPEAYTLHILPHWTWPGREGEVTPVFVYTNAEEAELFVNGKSQGRQKKVHDMAALNELKAQGDEFWMQRRYRLMWHDVKYEPGEVKVVAYDKQGKKVGEETLRTAGKPDHLVLERASLTHADDDLVYVTVSVADKDGNPCPTATDLVQFSVKGNGKFRAAANGDATCLDLFHEPHHHLFAGKCTAIVQKTNGVGTVTIEASAKGLKKARLTLK